jgi:2-isopropylmalate synthase
MEKLIVFDTTLRDGDQAAGAAMLPDDKVEVAKQLELLGVDVIEAGFPIASETEAKTVERIANEVDNSCICAFSRAVQQDIEIAAKCVKNAKGGGRVEISIPTSDIQLSNQIEKNREEVLEITKNSIKLARNLIDDVEWIGIDSTRADLDYLCRLVETAIESGAKTVSLADTLGFATPEEIGERVSNIMNNVPNIDKTILSIHCHDDLGLATANTLSAISSGVREVQCTMNGLGERAGNAPLEEIITAIFVKNKQYPFQTGINTKELKNSSNLVSKKSGFLVPPNKPIVGKNAFRHGSGIHQDALIKSAENYEFFPPEIVGAKNEKIVIGPHSGRNGLNFKLQQLGYNLSSDQLDAAYNEVMNFGGIKKEFNDEDLIKIVENTRLIGLN